MNKRQLARKIIALSKSGDPVYLFTWVKNNAKQIKLDSDNGDKLASLILDSYFLLCSFPDSKTWYIFLGAIEGYLSIELEKDNE